MRRPNAVLALVVVIVLVTVAQGGLAWVLIERDRAAVEAREQAAERAEERTDRVLGRVADLLDEIRDPESGSERADLFDRAARIERLVEDLHDVIEERP